MFETKKTLIVVYKDELLMNQLRKMVETHGGGEQGVVDTRELSINIISWTEKVWLGNKKAGNIQGKILFLGKISGTDKLIPIIDGKFDEYGVRFGWAGNQAVVYADPKELTARKDYDDFLEKLFTLPVPVPDILKPTKQIIATTGTRSETEPESLEKDEVFENAENKTAKSDEDKHKKVDIIEKIQEACSPLVAAIKNIPINIRTNIRTQVIPKYEEVSRNRRLMERQMLFFGVVSLYNDGLTKFMNM